MSLKTNLGQTKFTKPRILTHLRWKTIRLGFNNLLGTTHQEMTLGGFPGGAVGENLPANAEDTGSSPGLGGSHMPRSN